LKGESAPGGLDIPAKARISGVGPGDGAADKIANGSSRDNISQVVCILFQTPCTNVAGYGSPTFQP
jgi:hypothetical protein